MYISFEKFIIPNSLQQIIKIIYKVSIELIYINIKNIGKFYIPIIFNLFLFLLFCNLIGLIPYSFTITSHLIITFSLSLILFISFNIIGIQKHKYNFLNLLLPSGSNFLLIPLLIPIEFISYLFRLISLSIRLFANMMAGHTLVKVIATFTWLMVNNNLLFFITHFIPLFLLILLISLEFGVAIIQAYVFTILICIYINDVLHLH